MNKTIVGICTLIELGCVTALAAIGLKRNNDAYKAELKAIDAEGKLFLEEIKIMDKDYEIYWSDRFLCKITICYRRNHSWYYWFIYTTCGNLCDL